MPVIGTSESEECYYSGCYEISQPETSTHQFRNSAVDTSSNRQTCHVRGDRDQQFAYVN